MHGNSKDKIKKAFELLSFVNKDGYKDIYLLSNQVLSKNPFTNNFLSNYLKNKNPHNITLGLIIHKFLIYYIRSLRDYCTYIKEYILYKISFSAFKFSFNSKELVLIDAFFVVERIKKESSYEDYFFPGLTDLLEKNHNHHAYLPVFDGLKRGLTLFRLLKKLKNAGVPVLCEYQMLSPRDLLHILHFILFYPIRVLIFYSKIEKASNEMKLIRSELVETMDQAAFRNFSRFLQGRNISKLKYKNIKLISWYENQAVHKNLYRGLRENPEKVKIYGSQLFLYCRNHLNIIPDENEKEFNTLPDFVLVNGPAFIPEKGRLNYKVGPSLRYKGIFKKLIKRENADKILVLLPYFKEEIKNILYAVKNLENYSHRLLLKFHTVTIIDEFKYLIPQNAAIVEEDIYKLFAISKIIIGAASGTLIEAASLGLPVIVIKNNNGLENNPLPAYGKGVIWGEAQTFEELKFQINKFENLVNREYDKICSIAQDYKRLFFCEPTEEKIKESFDL